MSHPLITRIIEQESAWLAQQEGAVRAELLGLYKETFSEIRARIQSMKGSKYDLRQLRAQEAQLAVLIQEMGKSQGRKLGSGVQAVYEKRLKKEGQVWARLEQTFGDPKIADQFQNFLPVPNQQSIKALILTQEISIKGLTDDLTRETRRKIGKSMLQGEGTEVTLKRLAHLEEHGLGPGRIKLIARMEPARAVNEAKSDFIEQVNKENEGLEMWQMIRERVDHSSETRNHWMSWAIDGTVRNVTAKELFQVTSADLAKARLEWSAKKKRKASESGGVIWPLGGPGREGERIPATFGGREVLLGWRPTWPVEHFGQVKHPQGPIQKPPAVPPAPSGDSNPVQPPSPSLSQARRKSPHDRSFEEQSLVIKDLGTELQAKKVGLSQAQKKHSKDYSDWLDFKLDFELNRQAGALSSQQIEGGLAQLDILQKELENSKDSATLLAKELGQGQARLKTEFYGKPGPAPVQFRYDKKVLADPAHLAEVEKGTEFFENTLRGRFYFAGTRWDSTGIEIEHGEGLRPMSSMYKTDFLGNRVFAPRVTTNTDPSQTASTQVHELAHHLELASPKIQKKVIEFWIRRTDGTKWEKMKQLFPLKNYKPHEITKKDSFITPYVGKIYGGGGGIRFGASNDEVRAEFTASEIVSSGLEQIYADPVWFLEKDPDHFKLIWEIITGNV